MNRPALHIVICTIAMLFAAGEAFGQFMPERSLIRKGNRDYKKGDFAESEIEYLRAREKAPQSFEAGYNLGNAYYRQERFEEAAAAYSQPSPQGLTPAKAADSYYNAGNALFQQRKLEEALEAYKQALRINPGDMQAKFNLAYVKKLLEKDQDQNQDNQQDQNQDQQQDRNNQDNKNNQGDQNKDNGQGQNDQNKDKNDPQNQDQQQNDTEQQRSPGISKQEAEQMLDALEMSDEKTREKVDAQKGRVVGGSGKNW